MYIEDCCKIIVSMNHEYFIVDTVVVVVVVGGGGGGVGVIYDCRTSYCVCLLLIYRDLYAYYC